MPTPGEEAQDAELQQRARPRRREGEHAEHHVADEDRSLAAVAVADMAEQRRAEQHAEQAGAEHRTERTRRGDAPGLDQLRHREGRDRDVVAVDHDDEERQHHELEVEGV